MVVFLRIVVGIIFLISSISKLFDVDHFFATIHNFGYFPIFISVIGGILIIGVELLIAISFLLNFQVKIFSLVSVFLMLFFLAAAFPQFIMGNEIDCDCFGSLISGKTDIVLIIKDAILFAISLSIFFSQKEIKIELNNT